MTDNTNIPPLDDDEDYLGTTITIDPSTTWGASGQILTTGTNGLYWGDYASDIVSIGTSSKALTVKGDAQFESDITIKGVKLMETLEKIEERLNILRVDPQLEERWEKLRSLGEQYRALEAECIDKELIINILKS